MNPEVLIVDPEQPSEATIAVAAATIRRGELVAFPTETVYGLGANALDEKAVWRIYTAKGRVSTNPLIVHVASAQAAQDVVSEWPQVAQTLAETFWPGPLTLVLPKQKCVPAVVTGGGETVAVRAPSHPVARALLNASGLPIAAPSANPSNRISATSAEHVVRAMGDRVDLILDAGPTSGGLESTVLDLTVSPPRLLRPGLISVAAIEAALEQNISTTQSVPEASVPQRSPGMLSRHYAPTARLVLAKDDGSTQVEAFIAKGVRVGWLQFGALPIEEPAGCRFTEMPREAGQYATALYAELHRMNAAGVDRIVVAAIPEDPQWLAIRDRLQRAASPE